jgi:hypothetical protein
MSSQSVACSDPEQHSFYGWALYVDAGARFRCVVQDLEPWLLVCDLVPTLGDRLLARKHESEFRRVVEALAATLEQDPRFGSVRWFTRQEYESSPEARGDRE